MTATSTSRPPLFRTIVVGYDDTGSGRDALALAGLLAGPGTHVVVTEVIPFDSGLLRSGVGGSWAGSLRDDARARLERVDAGLLPAGVTLDRHVVRGGSAAHGLHDLAAELGADLVTLGSTRRGTLGRILLGSTAESLLRGAPCAVAVAPRGLADERGRGLYVIGVGYDGSPESEAALATAERLACDAGATLRVIAAVMPPAIPVMGLPYGFGEAQLGLIDEHVGELLDDALDRLAPETRAQGIKRRGDPATVLAAEGDRGADLLVVGSRGYGPLRRAVLGGVSAKLTRLAPCPVLIVPRGDPNAKEPARGGLLGDSRLVRAPTT